MKELRKRTYSKEIDSKAEKFALSMQKIKTTKTAKKRVEKLLLELIDRKNEGFRSSEDFVQCVSMYRHHIKLLHEKTPFDQKVYDYIIGGITKGNVTKRGALNVSREALEERKKEAKTKIDKRLDNVKSTTIDARLLLERATMDAQSFDVRRVICGLALLTGRRLGEIMSTGEIKKEGEFIGVFSGQLKSKKDHAYTIPLLISASDLIKKLRWLRKTIGTLSPNEAHHKYNRTIQNYTKKVYNCKPHTLRGIYAEIVTIKYNKTVDETRFKGYVLGHYLGSGSAATDYYKDVNVINIPSTLPDYDYTYRYE